MIEADACIEHLDFDTPLVCEIVWGKTGPCADGEAAVMASFVDGNDRTARRLACKQCVGRIQGQRRLIRVENI